MTALVFALQSDQVCLAMDTLVIGADDRMPLAFQRKFQTVPELELVIAGTGHADFINSWFEHRCSLLNYKSIDELDSAAPQIFRSSVEAVGGLRGLTVTIYHFGYSASEQCYVGYAYRSERNFQSEKLPYALGFKPVVPVTFTSDIRFPEFLVDIVMEQQRNDKLKPLKEQVGIGGEIEFVVMSDHTIHIKTVHRFSTYGAELQHIEQRAEA
jgi:hypothetical protein